MRNKHWNIGATTYNVQLKILNSNYEHVPSKCPSEDHEEEDRKPAAKRIDTFLSKTPIAPCYCQMMGQTLKEENRITQYNNPTKAGKYSLEDLFRASDNIPHHYPKF